MSKKFFLGAFSSLAFAGILTFAASPSYAIETSDITDTSDAIAGVVDGMTAAAIAPAGLSAAIKCFRHIILANV